MDDQQPLSVPEGLDIKVRASYYEWSKVFNYYVDFEGQNIKLPNGVRVRHKSTWSLFYGYPTLSHMPEFHVWLHEDVPEKVYREFLYRLAEIAEHVLANPDRLAAARKVETERQERKLQEEFNKLERQARHFSLYKEG